MTSGQDRLANGPGNEAENPSRSRSATRWRSMTRALVVGSARYRGLSVPTCDLYNLQPGDIFAPGSENSSLLSWSRQAGEDLKACAINQANHRIGGVYSAGIQRRHLQLLYEIHGYPDQFRDRRGAGFLIGTAIAGQTFYNFTLENLRYFGTLKAMGATNGILLRMILLQALMVGALGYGLGVGGASLFGYLFRGTELSFRLTRDLLYVSAERL